MKTQKQIQDTLQRLLRIGGMVRGFYPNRSAVIDFVKKRRESKKLFTMLYGETYDLLGITVDSLRYYLFLSYLHSQLQETGIVVESTVLIADTAATINASSADATVVLEEGKKRLKHINEIIRVYTLPIRATLMSELFAQQNVQKFIETVQAVVADSTDIQAILQKTVLQNRIHQEDKASYKYGAEAIATALLFDLKIGPPRERFYDEAARMVATKLNQQNYKSIYLTATYPLGLDFFYFLLHPEVEEYGLTPYKASSNKLENHRIIFGRTTPERVNGLIDTSFFPKHGGLPDPVGDVIDTAKLAGFFLEKHPQNAENQAHAQELYEKFVHEPLREVFI
ncbi:hypothetical protein HY086_04810 [Candidatus Gottesmanbacteria bacterium]|nr:hypothetical protein [Candidatus Gottesmanbacteria bacterium]